MRTYVDYGQITDENKKRDLALRDIEEYLGIERFNALDAMFRQFRLVENMPPSRFAMMLSLAGISGYPVFAWYCSIFGPEGETKYNSYLEQDDE